MRAARDIVALIAFIDSRHAIPHAIGRHANDCVSYALDAVEAQTGLDPVPGIDWKTRRQGLNIIRRFGSVQAGFDHHFQRIAPAQAMRGDIAGVADETFGIHPMIVEGATLVGPAEHGNRRLKREAMVCAWSAVQLKGAGSE